MTPLYVLLGVATTPRPGRVVSRLALRGHGTSFWDAA